MTLRRPTALLAAGLALAALAGCNNSEPEAPPVEANASDEIVEPLPEPAAPAPVEAPAPAPEPSAAPADEPASEPDEQTQMYDDADAVGMTARARRGDDGSTGDNTADAPESVDPR